MLRPKKNICRIPSLAMLCIWMRKKPVSKTKLIQIPANIYDARGSEHLRFVRHNLTLQSSFYTYCNYLPARTSHDEKATPFSHPLFGCQPDINYKHSCVPTVGAPLHFFYLLSVGSLNDIKFFQGTSKSLPWETQQKPNLNWFVPFIIKF